MYWIWKEKKGDEERVEEKREVEEREEEEREWDYLLQNPLLRLASCRFNVYIYIHVYIYIDRKSVV